MLLNTFKQHHTDTPFVFTLFVSMSRLRSIYVVSMLLTLTWMKNVNNFYIVKVQASDVA